MTKKAPAEPKPLPTSQEGAQLHDEPAQASSSSTSRSKLHDEGSDVDDDDMLATLLDKTKGDNGDQD